MKLFSIFQILFCIIFALNVKSIPDFCHGNPRIDGITKLSNGSLFLTSDRYYWTLKKTSEGFYENPTHLNVGGNINSLFSGIERIDSIETFSSGIGYTNEVCGDQMDLLMVYSFNERKSEPIMKFFINWKEVEFNLTEAITQNTPQIDWKNPINATLYYKLSDQIYYEIYQKGNCSQRKCHKNWNKPSNCINFQIDSIYCESSGSDLTVYGFSGQQFQECKGNSSKDLKCCAPKQTAFDFFRFDPNICKPKSTSPESSSLFANQSSNPMTTEDKSGFDSTLTTTESNGSISAYHTIYLFVFNTVLSFRLL